MILAVLRAQWLSMRSFQIDSRRRGAIFSVVTGVIWYGFWAFLAQAAQVFVASADSASSLAGALATALMFVFLYWQLAPLVSASLGASLDLKKLLVYPIPHGKLFVVEVLLRVTTCAEMVLFLAGVMIGLFRNPLFGGFRAAPRVIVPFVIFILFNLLLAAGTRSLLEQLLTHKRLREITMLLVVLAASIPQVLITTGSTPGPLKQWVNGAPWSFWPWSAVATSALGGDFVTSLAILAIWTGAAWRFGRWQFERGLNFDAQASGATSVGRPERSRPWLEAFYRSPSLLLPDPLAVIVEKELRTLSRTARFRMVFIMGFTFGLLVWLPLLLGRNPKNRNVVSEHYLTLVSVYALTLLGQVSYLNSFGFDRSAAQVYYCLPVSIGRAWIDDGDGGHPYAFVRAAPMMRDPLSQYFADKGRDWVRERWERVASYDPSVKPAGPETLPLGYLFAGAGHVYARSAWGDPNATWAFFGAGPQFAGHSRDDEGHFLISKKGALVSRAGGQGGNDDDYYIGGSIAYNLVTIFDPAEKFRRDQSNENDGGLLRHVYENGPWPRERGKIVAFEHQKDFTYAAADLTRGYGAEKTREVTRQFLYLRGAKEFVVVFDRVEATKGEFPRHWFLHVPTEPTVEGRRLTWLSLPEADGDKTLLSQGRSRAFLHALLPADSTVTTRGGPGKEAWGHPLEPKAQYNHETPQRKRPPICPWRIEVADPSKGARTLFLHVLEIADEKATQATDVKFVAPAGLDLGDGRKIRFRADGPLGGTLNGAELSPAVRIEGQYKP